MCAIFDGVSFISMVMAQEKRWRMALQFYISIIKTGTRGYGIKQVYQQQKKANVMLFPSPSYP